MALSHGSEKGNKKTANCCFLMRKINSYLVLSQQPKIREGVGRCPRQIRPVDKGNFVSIIRSSLELNQANKYLGNLLRKSYLPPQSSALSNQPLRHTVISIKDRRLDSLFPAPF